MKHIVNFSGGLCSFWSAKREIEAHGKDNVILLFADTLVEDSDLYDFNRRAEDYLGIQITRVCVGLTPWQLFRKEHLIGNDGAPICSIRLKREPLNAWMESNYELNCEMHNWIKPHATVVLGFDWTEHHRVSDFQLKHPTWTVSAPMTESPYWDKCKMLREAEKIGFKSPKLYELGFPHNNCGGACVRSGISHFVHLYKVLPHVFLDWERQEAETIAYFITLGIKPLSILKDRRGGVTKMLTLKMLRERIQAGEKFKNDEWGGCGCGGENNQPDEELAA